MVIRCPLRKNSCDLPYFNPLYIRTRVVVLVVLMISKLGLCVGIKIFVFQANGFAGFYGLKVVVSIITSEITIQ